MLMERVIHFLSTKRTWQAQFEWLHDGHMPSVILVSCARGASKGAVETTHEQAGELPSDSSQKCLLDQLERLRQAGCVLFL